MSSQKPIIQTIDTLPREVLQELARDSNHAEAHFWATVMPFLEELVRSRFILGGLARDAGHRREALHEILVGVRSRISSYVELSGEDAALSLSDWLALQARRIGRRYQRWYLAYTRRKCTSISSVEEMATHPSADAQVGSTTWALSFSVMSYARAHLPDHQYRALVRWLRSEDGGQTTTTRNALARLRRQFGTQGTRRGGRRPTRASATR